MTGRDQWIETAARAISETARPVAVGPHEIAQRVLDAVLPQIEAAVRAECEQVVVRLREERDQAVALVAQVLGDGLTLDEFRERYPI